MRYHTLLFLLLGARSLCAASAPPTPPYEANQVKNTVLREAADPIQSCFKPWAKKHVAFRQGKIHVDWEIQPDGRTRKVHIIHSDLKGMEPCVAKTLGKIVFPEPPGKKPYYVAHRFFFKRVD